VYSLGLVLVEMLTGRLPTGPEDASTVLGEHTRDSSHEPQPLRHAIPPAARRIVLRALARDPAARYRSAGAFASALHQYLLLEAGSTMPFLPSRDGEDDIFASVFKQVGSGALAGPTSPHPTPSGSHSIPRGVRASHPHRLTLMGLVFIVVLAAAIAGGWLAYRAVSNVLKQWGLPPGAGAALIVRHTQSTHLASSAQVHVPIAPQSYPYVRVLDTSKNAGSRVQPGTNSIRISISL
jgi:serine/threonine-protein kinase